MNVGRDGVVRAANWTRKADLGVVVVVHIRVVVGVARADQMSQAVTTECVSARQNAAVDNPVKA